METKTTPEEQELSRVFSRLRFHRRMLRAMLAGESFILGVVLCFLTQSYTLVDFTLTLLGLTLCAYGFMGLMQLYRKNVKLTRELIREMDRYARYLEMRTGHEQ